MKCRWPTRSDRPSTYYYQIPVRPIYKSYPVYVPGREPAGYMDWLKQQEPQILWDDKGHAPPLNTDADWIKAGEVVFDAPVAYGPADRVRNSQTFQDTKTPLAADGTVPFFRYVVREKGKVEVGFRSCGSCHTRIMQDGSILKGAQGNLPFDRVFYYRLRHSSGPVEEARLGERFLFSAPKTYAVKGHPFGLNLSEDDRKAQIAFLKTL